MELCCSVNNLQNLSLYNSYQKISVETITNVLVFQALLQLSLKVHNGKNASYTM